MSGARYFATVILLLLVAIKGSAQQLSLGNTPYMVNKSAVLELNATKQGLLLPRLADTAGINALNPPDGMIVYFAPSKQFLLRANGYWNPLAVSSALINYWNTSGNANGSMKTFGTTDNYALPFVTNNQERMRISAAGRVGIGVSDPTNYLAVKDTIEIRRSSSVASLLFANTGGTGDFRIAGDGGDLFWQGGGGRNLQMGSYWGMILSGDRQNSSFPAFSAGTGGIGVLIPSQRTASVPLAIQAIASQTANLTEWRSSSNSILSTVTSAGNFGIGTSAPSTKLHVVGTNPLTLNGVQPGGTTTADSVLTINNGTVQKVPANNFVTTANTWLTTGNTGTSWANHFMGTNDNTSLRFRTNNMERMILDSLGNLGIGSNSFNSTNPEQLLVDAGNTTSYNLMTGKGIIDNYLQINIQNKSATTNASSDIVATADNGDENSKFIDMGINSSAFGNVTYPMIGGTNTAYLYSTGTDFVIGNATANQSLRFFTGGYTLASERMRIDGNGNVGIGTTAPNSSTKLDVSGSVKIGSSGSVIKNMVTATGTFTSAASVSGAAFNGLAGSITPAIYETTYTLPAANTLASTQATVTVSPSVDLPNGVSIAYARATSTTVIKVRFINSGTAAQSIASGTKLYFTITDF